MSIAFGVALPPPPAVPDIWVGLPMTWEGADGSKWDLTNRAGGVLMRPGVRGLLFPPFTRYTSDSPAVPGSRHKGSRAGDRDVFWPVKVFDGRGSVEWLALNRRWWRSFDPDKTGTWTVHHPTGETRALTCRLEGVEDDLDKNPVRVGWQNYRVRLVGAPFWEGQPLTQFWRSPDSRSFFNVGPDVDATLQILGDTVTATGHGLPAGRRVRFRTITGTTGISVGVNYYVVNPAANTFQLSATSGGPVIDLTGADGSGVFNAIADYLLHVSTGSNIASATMSNEGDEPAYPTWVGVGPFTALTVGMPGETLSVPFSVPSGKAVEIDTHPVTGQRLWFGDWDGQKVINRTNRTNELSGDQRFSPIPAGGSRQLSLSMTGTGMVSASIRPLFRSAL